MPGLRVVWVVLLGSACAERSATDPVVVLPAPSAQEARVVPPPARPRVDVVLLAQVSTNRVAVPLACNTERGLAGGAACARAVRVGDPVAGEALQVGSRLGHVASRANAPGCPKIEAFQLVADGGELGYFQTWPAERGDVVRQVAWRHVEGAERDAVLRLAPPEARAKATELAGVYDPIVAFDVQLDDDGVMDRIYVVNVAATLDPQNENIPDDYAWNGLAMRLSRWSEPRLARTAEDFVQINRVTDLDANGRVELLLMSRDIDLMVLEGETLVRAGTTACAR